MAAPLDPVIAQIIPLLPLRDPTTMTPQSARDALRALAASRAAVPPPPVDTVQDIKVKGGAGPLDARVYRVGRSACADRRVLPWRRLGRGRSRNPRPAGAQSCDRDRRGRRLRRLSAPAGNALSRRLRGRLRCRERRRSTASRNLAAMQSVSASPATAPAAISQPPPRSPAATPASSSPRSCWSIP